MSQTKAQLISDLVQALNFTGISSAPANGVYLSAANTIKLATNSNGRLTIDSDGKVGIGTTSPSSIFHVRPLDETNFLVRNEGSTVVLASETNSGRDNNRGMALEATAFEFIEGGSEKMRIDSSGNVGIGTTSPNNKLDVNGGIVCSPNTDGKDTFELSTHGANEGRLRIKNVDTTTIQIRAGGDTYFNGGNVGIGTTSPDSVLNCYKVDATAYSSTASDGQVGVGPSIYLYNPANSNTTVGGQIVFGMRSTETQCRIVATGGSSPQLAFTTNDAERMRIDSSGNVGIGTTSPGQRLGVAGNIRFESADPTLEFNNGGGMVYARVANTLQFATGGGPSSPQEKMRIDSSGRLLIADAGTATNTPMETFGSAILQLATSGGASIVLGRNDTSVSVDQGIGNIYFDGNVASGGAWNDVARISCAADGTHADGDYPSRLTFHTTADSAATVSERLRIDSNGYVGIKLTNPHLYYAKDLVVQAISQGGITVKSVNTTDTNYLMFADGTSGNERYRGYIGYAHNTGADNGEHMQFAASGGTGLMRFYADGLALGGETATANRLNDYEEGTFTAAITVDTGTNPSQNAYTHRYAYYRKIGKIVHIRVDILFGALSSPGSGNAVISGLPFVNSNQTNAYGVTFSSGYSPNWGTNNHPTQAYITNNTSEMYLMKNTVADGVQYVQVANIVNGTRVICGATYMTDV